MGGEALDALRDVNVSAADLGGSYLGLAYPDSREILIDDDAAGHGWYVDPTPTDDREFRRPGEGAVTA